MHNELRTWAATVPPGEIPDALSEIEGARAILWARLITPPANGNGRGANAEFNLTPDRVAERLGVGKRWVYRHADDLGGRKLSHRRLRFSEAGVSRHLATRSPS